MLKNNDFYSKNERFSGLIKYYARKLGDREAEADLWSFLWVLQNTSIVLPSDPYIAVCLRNRFRAMLRERRKNSFLPLYENYPDKQIDIDEIIDLKTIFGELNETEKELVASHFLGGYTYEEIAKKEHNTKQAQSYRGRKILSKMRKYFGCV
jgi:hypothetical protein